MYRIKNEEHHIELSLKHTSKVCDEIVILDDGSTDKTVEICNSFSNVVDIHMQKDLPYDEWRDRTKLLEMALKRKPDYLLGLDADHVFQPGSDKLLFHEIKNFPDITYFKLQNYEMWDHPNQRRCDGYNGNTWQPRLCKVPANPEKMEYAKYDGPLNIHIPAVPQNMPGNDFPMFSGVKILHYGKFTPEKRKQKFDFMNKIDPNNEDWDGYKHIISGEGKHSGPNGMEFEILKKGDFLPNVV